MVAQRGELPKIFEEQSTPTFPFPPGVSASSQWYHGPITRTTAERLLLTYGRHSGLSLFNRHIPLHTVTETDGVFLIRESSADYVVSMVFEGKIFHYKIQKTHGGFHFYGNDFPTLTDLVEHHKVHAGKLLCLLTTSPQR